MGGEECREEEIDPIISRCAELRAAISEHAEQADGPTRLMTEGRAEEISILMQMLGGDQKLKVILPVGAKLVVFGHLLLCMVHLV